ncbi:MAG: hypothetical protein QOI48_3579 [Solirubrobacteraceae bacterium]|jgi:hypothetical protein|nr:hypothetical protein [Solirubrobacteraceae bacterium]
MGRSPRSAGPARPVSSGTGKAGFNVGRAPANAVALAYPTAIAALTDGRALVADTLNDRVRLLDLARSTLLTVAGRAVPGPPGTPEPALGATLKPPDAPDGDALIVTARPKPSPARTSGRGGGEGAFARLVGGGGHALARLVGGGGNRGGARGAFERAPSGYCARPGDPDPRRFSDLHILPFSARVLKTGPRLRVQFAVNRDVTLVTIVTRAGSIVRSRKAEVNAGGLRSLALKGKLMPGSYRLELQATSHTDRLRRCDARKLRVRR